MFQRTHPAMIFTQLRRFLYILIIPAVRGFFSALFSDFWGWLAGAWLDIGALSLIFLLAILRWQRLAYRLDEQGITVRSGLLLRQETLLLWSKIATITITEPFYLRPLHVVFLRADTLGGNRWRPDVSLILLREDSGAFFRFHGQIPPATAPPRPTYIPGTWSLLLLALLTSHSLTGVLFLATFVSQSGKLLGAELSRLIVNHLWDISHRLAFGLPPIAAAAAYVLLGGWAVGFLFVLVRYRHFSISRWESTPTDFLGISGGLGTRRHTILRQNHVNFIDIRQNILALVLGLSSLYASVAGYGKGKGDISCLIPAEAASRFAHIRQQLFPGLEPASSLLRPAHSSVMAFIGLPLALCGLLITAGLTAVTLFAAFHTFILFVCLMLLVPVGLLLAVRLREWRTGGCACSPSHYTMCYSRRFIIHTAIIPADKITRVVMVQTPFQLLGGGRNCRLLLYTASEGRARHICRSLPKAEAQAFLKQM